MATIAFDTLKLARKLEAAGFAPKQAADTAEALASSLGEVTELATRQDIKELELRLDSKIESVKGELMKGMFGVALGQIGAIVALLKLL